MSKPVKAPTAEEMLQAIQDAIGPEPHDPGVTVSEYAKANGISTPQARGALERGVAAGKLLRGLARKQYIDGRRVVVPVYRVP